MAKGRKPCSSSTAHPPYPEVMSDATLILEDQAGANWPAVSEFIAKPLPSGSDRSLFVPTRKFVESERLLKSSCKAVSLTEDVGIPEKEATKEQKATRKTRRLSQVKTPEALKKATRKRKSKAMVPEVDSHNGGKIKRLSQVKTPKGFKNGDKKNTKKTMETENVGIPEKEATKGQRATRKTPEALKKATRKRKSKAMVPEVDGRNGGKMKRLSQVKTPEGFKKGDKKNTKKTMETRQ